jgi:uroporphyrinogen decarboxylase
VRPIERVEAAVEHKETDRIPVFTCAVSASSRVLGVSFDEFHRDAELAGKCLLAWNELIGDDIICGFWHSIVEASGFGQEICYRDNEPPYLDNFLIQTPDDYYKLEPYDPMEAPQTRALLNMVEMLVNEAQDTPVMGAIMAPLEVMVVLRGVDKTMMDCIRHPEALKHAFRVILEVNLKMIKELGRIGVWGINVGAALAAGNMMSEKLWREIEGEFYEPIMNAIREVGARTIPHNCAKRPYMGPQLEMCGGADIYDLADVPHDCQDWHEAKEKYGDQTCFMGYIDAPTFLATGTPEEVKAEIKKEIDELGKGGGLILMPSCILPDHASMLNARAMVEAAEEYAQNR